MQKRYFKENKSLLKFIKKNKDNIIQIKPIKRLKRKGIIKGIFISSYCVIYKVNV